MNNAKVTKIWINPSKTRNLGNYNSVKIEIGMEVAFNKPISIGSKEIDETYKEISKRVEEQYSIQFEPYKKYLESKKAKGGE